MDEPAYAPNPYPPQDEKPPEKLGLATKIILGTVFVLALTVVILQLSMSGVFSGRERESVNNFIPPEPESSLLSAPEAPVDPPRLPTPQAAGATDVSQRAIELANRLGGDTNSLIEIVAELNDRLELAEEELRGTRALYAAAARKILLLEKDVVTARRNSTQLETLGAQLAESQALLSVAERRSEALMKKLAASPDPKMLREAQAMRDVYEAELRQTKDRLARDVAEKARLQADLSAATSELAATEIALESTELFIDSIDLLPTAAKQLFLELSRLETVDRAELAKNYRLIEQKLGARVVDTIRFGTGKSEISAAKEVSIGNAMVSGRSDSFFLVIGYASKTGSFDLNKELSEARATAVATSAVESAKPGQKVRAVFLGQTDRFSSSDVRDDQICELWEIPK